MYMNQGRPCPAKDMHLKGAAGEAFGDKKGRGAPASNQGRKAWGWTEPGRSLRGLVVMGVKLARYGRQTPAGV